MATQNIHGGLNLVEVEEARGKQSGIWLVRRGETILGMLEKYTDTKSYYHPWKAFVGHGLAARFLGAYYEPRKGWEVREDMNMGGKNGAINAIVNAAV
jgi:hypothetical protein